jgi:hypothetical protein
MSKSKWWGEWSARTDPLQPWHSRGRHLYAYGMDGVVCTFFFFFKNHSSLLRNRLFILLYPLFLRYLMSWGFNNACWFVVIYLCSRRRLDDYTILRITFIPHHHVCIAQAEQCAVMQHTYIHTCTDPIQGESVHEATDGVNRLADCRSTVSHNRI